MLNTYFLCYPAELLFLELSCLVVCSPINNFYLHWSFCRLEEVGWFRWNAAQGPQTSLKKPLYCDLSLAYSNLGGRELTVSVVNFWPTFQLVKSSNGSLQARAGSDTQLIKTIAGSLNFT